MFAFPAERAREVPWVLWEMLPQLARGVLMLDEQHPSSLGKRDVARSQRWHKICARAENQRENLLAAVGELTPRLVLVA